MPLVNYTSELIGTFPRLPPLHAAQLVERAWTRVRDMRIWSWQTFVDQQIFAPTIISVGTASTVQYSNIVTVDTVVAAPALNAAGPIPPLASATIGAGRQIRVGAASSSLIPNNYSIYNIIAWDGVSRLTIDKPFAEGTLTNSSFQVFRMYYNAPANPALVIPGSDGGLIRFIAITNRNTGYTITGKRLYWSQDRLDRIDAVRGAQGDPYYVAPYQNTPTGLPTFEFYPCPILQTAYAASYYSRWPSLSAIQDLPSVPYGLTAAIMDLARSFACQFLLANVTTFPELAQTNWVAAGQNYRQDWMDGIKMCIRQDDEIAPEMPFLQGRRAADWQLGGAFLQNHDVSSLLQ